MSSNWRDAEICYDESMPYRIDNHSLQRGLGLPIEVVGVSRSPALPSLQDELSQYNIPDVPPVVLDSKHHGTPIEKITVARQTIDGIPVRKIYVKNINKYVVRSDITNLFGLFGQIIQTYLSVTKHNPNKQFAFITFKDPLAASRVLAQKKLYDPRGAIMYVVAADSWHQPKEDANGRLILNNKREQTEERDEEEDSINISSLKEIEVIEEDGLNKLNDDCLLHIFSYLSLKEIAGIERVCKRWQELSYTKWKFVRKLSDLGNPWTTKFPRTLILTACLVRCGPWLLELDLSKYRDFDKTTLAVIAKHCKNLEVLKVYDIHTGNRGLAHIAHNCSKLRHLTLIDCTRCQDQDLLPLLQKCPINTLEISENKRFTGKCLTMLSSPLKNLRISNLPMLQASNLIEGLKIFRNSLEILQVNNCGYLGSSDLEKVLLSVPNLKSLSIIIPTLSSYSSTQAPFGQLKNLTKLDLGFNNFVTDGILGVIVDGCEHLTEVRLPSEYCSLTTSLLTENGLSMLCRLKQLEYLDISNLEPVTDKVLTSIANNNSKLRECICRRCIKITDDGASKVIRMCIELTTFDLSFCTSITEATKEAAIAAVTKRTNKVPLKLIAGGTGLNSTMPNLDVPLLTIDLDPWVDLGLNHHNFEIPLDDLIHLDEDFFDFESYDSFESDDDSDEPDSEEDLLITFRAPSFNDMDDDGQYY